MTGPQEEGLGVKQLTTLNVTPGPALLRKKCKVACINHCRQCYMMHCTDSLKTVAHYKSSAFAFKNKNKCMKYDVVEAF